VCSFSPWQKNGTRREANADAASTQKLFARMNALLNRRSYIRISSQVLKRSWQRNAL